ncbi:MAG: extracellular solute-binding protein [Propionibacteriales bacterium]|nr:extracellular solute-binding protein [Propionibacteriales bacterium]
MKHALRPLAAAAAVPLSFGLAACGGGSGFDEDALVIYSGRQEALVADVIDDFEAESGVDVQVRYGNTAQLAAQLIEEGERSPADVYFAQDGGALGALAKAGQLATLPDDVLGLVEEKYRSADGDWVGVSGRARVMVYDPDQLSEDEVPGSVFDLTGPEWKGKVGIAPSNASFEAFVTSIRVLEGEDKAREFLDGLAANDVQTFDNNILVLNAAEDGLISVGLINHYYWYEQVAEEGLDAVPARLKYLRNADPGALVNVAGAGVLESTDKSAEAEQFVKYLLSKDAQTYFAEETKEYPLIEGVPTAEGVPPLDTLNPPEIDLADLDTLEETLAMIQEAGLT